MHAAVKKEKKLENCVCKTQVMPPCPEPVLTPCPILPMTLNTFNQYRILMSKMPKSKIAVTLSKIIFLCAKKYIHIFNMLLIDVQILKMNA